MKKYAKYVEWVVALVLLFVPCLVFAIKSDVLMDLSAMNFTPPSNDLSLSFLAQMFGSVPVVSQMTTVGRTIVGSLFNVFNLGVLGISGVFLGYTTFQVITKTMSDGSAMSSSATMWTAVRVGSSVTMLVPGASGYSLINGIVMWLVVQSIGLADLTWNAALDYLKTGVPTTIQKAAPGVDYTLIDNYSLVSEGDPTSVGSADVLRSLVCAYTIRDALNKYPVKGGTASPNISWFLPYKEIPLKSDTAIDASVHSGGGYYQFPYVEGEFDPANIKDTASQTNKYPFYKYDINIPKDVGSVTGICGTIGYGLSMEQRNGVIDKKDYKIYLDLYAPAKRKGLETMIKMLAPIAEDLVERAGVGFDSKKERKLDPYNYIIVRKDERDFKFYASGGAPGTEIASELTFVKILQLDDKAIADYAKYIKWPSPGADEMLQAAIEYQVELANPRITNISIFKMINQATSSIYDTAKEKGWILAGSYYTLLNEQMKAEALSGTFFRLTGYFTNADGVVENGDTEKYGKKVAAANRAFVPSNAFFTNYGEGGENPKSSLRQLFEALDIAKDGTSIINNDTSSNETLRRVFAWVYFSYPYAKVRGRTLAPQVDTSLGQKGIDKKEIKIFWSQLNEEWQINLMVAAGCIFVIIPPITPIAALFLPAGLFMLHTAPMMYLQYDIMKIMETWNKVMSGDTDVKDPIVKLQILGRSMITNSLAYFDQIERMIIGLSVAFMVQGSIFTLVIAAVGLGSFWGVTTGVTIAMQTAQSFMSTINEIIRTVIFMYIPIGLAVTGPLLVTGVTLAVYIPLIPYMLFLFGVMSWFISVFILMAAAPIICFMMIWGSASQENPLLSREAEQFVQQLVSAFFRPTLMIIGLVIGVVLARTGVNLLNSGFDIIASNVFSGSGNENKTIKMIEQIGVVVIYTFTMISLINICFSTIHLLHSEVMGAVGIRVSAGGMEEKAMGEIKAGATEFAQAGSAGAKEQSTSFKGAMNAAPKEMSGSDLRSAAASMKEEDKEKKSKEDTNKPSEHA
ncbi:MAG: DotA/TraY family protein [bacterium]